METGGIERRDSEPRNGQTNWDDSKAKTLSALKCPLLVAGVIFLVEGGVMDLLHHWFAADVLIGHHMLVGMLDAFVLTTSVFPVLYFFHYKPLNTFAARLSSSENSYRKLIDVSPDSIVALSNGEILFANQAALKALGTDRHDQVVGKTFRDIVHPDYHKVVQERIAMIEKEGIVAPLMEGKILRVDGTALDMEWTSAPLPCDGRRAILIVARDISKRKKAERKLAEAQSQLARTSKLASIGRLSTGLAHEIKNPLNIIALAAQMRMMDESLDAETKEVLRTVIEQTNRASEIIDKLKVFARGRQPEAAVFDLHEYLVDLEKLAGEGKAANGVAMTVDLHQGPIMLRGDPGQLCEALQILLSNAYDSARDRMASAEKPAPEKNGVKPAITIRTRVSEGKAVINVEDTGAGIRETDMEKIFDPFFSTKPPGKGAGLGLSTALGVIETHGGTIDVESVFGKGSTFTVTLPLAGE